MRWLALLLLLGRLAAVDLPTIERSDPAALAYDLGATAPWMPLLWDRGTLHLPTGTSRVEVVARLSDTGYAVDASDLLALRDGYRVTLTAGGFTVAGIAGTWNGVRSGTDILTARIDRPISSADLLLLCRQLHYANLGGERSLARRGIVLTVRADAGAGWIDSGPLTIEVDPVAADQPPKLRFDAMAIPLGGAVDWRPLAWYDGRQAAAQLNWRIQALPAICTATGITAGTRSEATAALSATAQSLDWFATAQLQLQAGSVLDGGVASLVVGDGGASGTAAFDVSVVPVAGELEIIGDLPFAVQAMQQVRLRASRPDVGFVACRAHPATGLDYGITAPFSVHTGNGEILLLFDRLPAGQAVIEGCAVFAAGGSTFRLPYRIAVRPGVAN